MTEQENELLDMLGEVWTKWSSLPDMNQSETTDVAFHIHALQRIVGARPTWRALIQNAATLAAKETA